MTAIFGGAAIGLFMMSPLMYKKYQIYTAEKAYKTEYLSGIVQNMNPEEVLYSDTIGFGSSHTIKIPITFMDLNYEGKTDRILIPGPHDLKEGDDVEIECMLDSEVTGEELFRRYQTKRSMVNVSAPKVKFDIDCYAKSWKKIQ